MSGSAQRTDVPAQIERQHRGLRGKPDEAVMEIEGLGSRRNRLHHDRARRDLLGCAQRSRDGIGQQGRAETMALPTCIDRQPAKDHGRDVLRHVAAHCAGNVGVEQVTHAERIVPDDVERAGGTGDVGPAGAGQQVGARAALQPFVEAGFARAEKFQSMLGRDRRRRARRGPVG